MNTAVSVLKDKKLFIFDMDGTIYLGGNPFDFAIRYIKNLRANGKKVLLDIKGVLNRKEYEDAGYCYWRL